MSETNSEENTQTEETKSEELDTIIIAEDSAPNRKILAHLLVKLGFHVVACEDGQNAWDALVSGEHKRVVAVISDIMMPRMDGISLLRNVRENETWNQLPVVLVTAVSEKDYIVQAKQLNVNGYILKPVTFQRVSTKLKELFPDRPLPKLVA